MAITAYGQNSASVDTLQTGSDSTSVGSHAEFSAARQESNVTKAEGDSAYIRNDYVSAIQIYENLLKKERLQRSIIILATVIIRQMI